MVWCCWNPPLDCFQFAFFQVVSPKRLRACFWQTKSCCWRQWVRTAVECPLGLAVIFVASSTRGRQKTCQFLSAPCWWCQCSCCYPTLSALEASTCALGPGFATGAGLVKDEDLDAACKVGLAEDVLLVFLESQVVLLWSLEFMEAAHLHLL